jgi:hypothetical protein
VLCSTIWQKASVLTSLNSTGFCSCHLLSPKALHQYIWLHCLWTRACFACFSPPDDLG